MSAGLSFRGWVHAQLGELAVFRPIFAVASSSRGSTSYVRHPVDPALRDQPVGRAPRPVRPRGTGRGRRTAARVHGHGVRRAAAQRAREGAVSAWQERGGDRGFPVLPSDPRWGRPAQPACLLWRPALALALRDSAPQEAGRLVAEELEITRGSACRGPWGWRCGPRGCSKAGSAGSACCVTPPRRSSGPQPAGAARALTDLGGALRRAGRRAEARKPLARGLELARACGAPRLAERAEQELRATGARPRAAVRSGLDALTPSELRVCLMAAQGMSNPEIAQSLFVTRGTVESQLHSAYSKLDIRSRRELASRLEPNRPDPT